MKSYLTQFLILASLWLFPALSRADSELDVSVKGGLNAATLDHADRDNRYGFSGGLSAALQQRLADQLFLGGQLELLYTPRGAETVVDGVTQGESREHYIDLGLTVRPEVRFNSVHVYLLLGGSIDFLVSANKDNISGNVEDITSGLRRIDAGLLGGLGVAIGLSHGPGSFHVSSIFLEARHDIGLLDTDPAGSGFKNRTSSIMLGLSFAIASSPGSSAPSTSQTAALFSGRSISTR